MGSGWNATADPDTPWRVCNIREIVPPMMRIYRSGKTGGFSEHSGNREIPV